MVDITSYRKKIDYTCCTIETSFSSNLLNDFISCPSQLNRIFNLYQESPDFMKAQILEIGKYQKKLLNIISLNSPFRILINDYKQDNNKNTETIISLNLDTKKRLHTPVEGCHIKYTSDHICDCAIAKILRTVLHLVRESVSNTSSNLDMFFQTTEDSINELPKPNFYQTTNASFISIITEIKSFLYSLLPTNMNLQRIIELTLLLYTKLGGLDTFLEWVDLMMERIHESHCVVRTEVLYVVLQYILTVNCAMTNEIKSHIEDCLGLDIDSKATISLEEAIEIMFIVVLRLRKMERNGDVKLSDYNLNSDKTLCSDIFVWEYDKMIDHIKSAYPDSLCTRLKSSTQKPYNKQVDSTQTELIMVNSLGEVSIRSLVKGNKLDHSIKQIISAIWLPVQFPDQNTKIDQICVSCSSNDSSNKQHVLAVTKNGQLFSWGGGQYGKLGHGDSNDLQLPKLIVGLRGYFVEQISAGINHSAAVTETGLSFIWGDGRSFNNDNIEPCLIPKRLKQGIMSKIICGPQCTFMVNFNQKEITYMGTSCSDLQCYKDQFMLPVHPNLIKWKNIDDDQTLRGDTKSEKIQKVVVNSTGLLVLLTNGQLYSIGHGLIIGCSLCQVHQVFDRVKAVKEVYVNDVALSESHVVVLAQDVIYSWSITATTLVLIQQSLSHHVTSVSAIRLTEDHKQVNIAWSTKKDAHGKSSRTIDSNPYLYSNSILLTLTSFKNIFSKFTKDIQLITFFERNIQHALKLLIVCVKSEQFNCAYLETDEFTEGDGLILALIDIYDQNVTNDELIKIIKEAIQLSSKVVYQCLDNRTECILKLLAPGRSLQSLSAGRKILLNILIQDYDDHNSADQNFNKLCKLPIDKLSDLLISLCRVLTSDMIFVVQEHLNSARGGISKDLCVESLNTLLNQCASIGYKIYLGRVQDCRTTSINHNFIKNLCQVLPMVNSAIDYLKSYLHNIQTKCKINQWILTSDAKSVNCLFFHSPLGWIMFDILFSLLQGHHKNDPASLIPHISSTIMSLNEINILLPNTSICDKQESHFPLYGFPSLTQATYSLPESALSWLWLIDLERLAGLLYGNMLMFIVKFVDGNADLCINKSLNTPLFKHVCQLDPPRRTDDSNLYGHGDEYNKLLNIFLFGDKYRLLARNGILYFTGLEIYITIVNLVTSRYCHIGFEKILRLFGISYSFNSVIDSVLSSISSIINHECFGDNTILTEEDNNAIILYAKSIIEKCRFLQNLLSEIVKNIQTEFVNDKLRNDDVHCSMIVDALDLRSDARLTIPGIGLRKSKSMDQIRDTCADNNMSVNIDCLQWLKEIYPSLVDFLTTDNLLSYPDNIDLMYWAVKDMRIKYKRTTATVVGIDRLFDTPGPLLDSVFIQILNGILESNIILFDLSSEQTSILETVLRNVLKKLKRLSEIDDSSAVPRRMCASILSFISKLNIMNCNFIRMIIEENVFGSIVSLLYDRPFISTDNWLIMEGNGDENLRNVCNMIAWCCIEDLLLNLSMLKLNISEMAKMKLEDYIINFVEDIYQQINDDVCLKIFDLYVLLLLSILIYSRTDLFRRECIEIRWIDLLLRIATIMYDHDLFNIFYSKYAIHLCANDLLSLIISDMIGSRDNQLTDDLLIKSIKAYGQFYYYLLTEVPKLQTKRLIKSIECRFNSFKEIRSNDNQNQISNWIYGNGNFDRNRTHYCDFLSNDKISVSPNNFVQFLAVTHEGLNSGVWQVTIEVSCTDSQIEFACGFVMNDKNQWPYDYQGLMELKKVIQPISLSSKASILHRLECVIDIDECIVYFINGRCSVQTFSGREGFYRFFLKFSAESRIMRGTFEAHVISVKRISHAHVTDTNNVYNNVHICHDDDILRSKLYETVLRWCDKKPQLMFKLIIRPLTEQLKFCCHIDYYSEKKITDPSSSVDTMFALFLLCGISRQHRLYRGELCTYLSPYTDEHHPGVILNFDVKLKSKFGGLNFVDRLADSSDIHCTIHSLSTNVPLRIPIKDLIKDEIYGETILEKYFRIVFPHEMDAVIDLLMSLLKCISLQFYDNDVSNFDEMPWASETTSDYQIEYQFMKCLSTNLFLQIIDHDSFLEYFSMPRIDNSEKNFKLIFQTIVRHATKPSPMKQISDTSDFVCCSTRLMEGFHIMRSEIDLGLAKKYNKLFLQSKGKFLSKREEEILIRALKRSCSKEVVESLINQSNNSLSMVDGGSTTFNIRRRVLDSSITSDHTYPMPNIALPQNEYDGIAQNQEMASLQNYEVLFQRQRLIQAFFTAAQNSKSKVSRACPICGVVLKSDTGSVFAHLSLSHSHNCKKTFQHQATKGVDLDGLCHDIEIKYLHCATVTDTLYCVCVDYLTKKSPVKEFRDDYETFAKEHYETNPLIGWTGSIPSEEYSYQAISDVKVYQPLKRPEIEEVSILGDNIFKEVNESKTVFNKLDPDDKCVTSKLLCSEAPFICQMNSGAIIKALTRLQYSNVVMSSRDIILKLVKLIYKRKSRLEVSDMSRRYMLNDIHFMTDLIRLVECGRFNFDTSVPDVEHDIQLMNFGKEDFLSTLIVAFEDSLDLPEKIHQFLQTFIYRLENLLTSTSEYFNLSRDADKTVLECPSRLLVQILANMSIRILEARYNNYEYWQTDVERIVELCSFGIVNNICGVRDKIWCLNHMTRMLLLIKKRKPLADFNNADMCDDLSTDDAQVVYLTNGRVKKLISTTNSQYILTADCEGTLRIWDIDSKMGLQQHLQYTLLFSLGEMEPTETRGTVESSSSIDDCTGVRGVSKNDVFEYLNKVAVQHVAVSFNGLYIAETIGVYLNIWSTRSVFSQPQLVTLSTIATALHFPELTFNGLCGAPVDLLLVGLANGQLLLLRILDNGARITQKIIMARNEENISISALAWNKERNPIAVGYDDGLIVLTGQLSDSVCTTMETIHSGRIIQLLYCPYVTKFGKYLLASASIDEAQVAIWKSDRIVSVIVTSNSVTCMEWLPRTLVSNSNNAMIVIGTSVGTVEMWNFYDSGKLGENVCSFYGHVSAISILKICLNTGILISGCGSGVVNVWHIQDRSLLSTFRGSETVVGAEWTPQNNLVVAWSQAEHVNVWQHFNDAAFQKNGLRQWAIIRQMFLTYTGVNTIKHLTNLKLLMVSVERLITQQFNDEESFVKCGYSIVYSQYLQALIQFVFTLGLQSSFIPCSKLLCLDVSPKQRQTIQREVNITNIYQRRTRCHALNRNHCVSRSSDTSLDWFFDVDELIKVTRVICFDDDQDNEDVLPMWWWNWCFESDGFAHNFKNAKWNNRYWNWDMQTELNDWFQSSPIEWISNYRSSIYMWGCGKKGELNYVTNREWERPTLVNMNGIQQVVCGSALTLMITANGSMLACGEGLEIVFNPYLREESSKMILVPVLSDFAISQVSVSKGPESHIIAITTSGDVYSWGIGSHGKLGHGHGSTLKKPKLIEGLRGKGAIQADCGDMHSAVVTVTGKLYTFGLGANGQLGVEILTGTDTPRLVAFDDDDVKIGYVACGSLHTVAMTQDGTSLYAFGSGTFGKLGVGDFENSYSPVKVNLGKNTLLKIACGSNFSVALTDRGEVLSWGHADYVGLSEPDGDCASSAHLTIPTLNHNLANDGVSMIDISAGNDVTFAVSTTGFIYGWGSNNHNLLLAGTTPHIYLPHIIAFTLINNFKQISCGRNHVSASCYSPPSYRYDIPTGPPLMRSPYDFTDSSKYPILAASELTRVDLTARLVLILYWNELIRLTWQFWLPLTIQKGSMSLDNHGGITSPDVTWPLISSQSYLLPESSWTFVTLNHFRTSRLRSLINNGQINNALYRYISSSMITNRSYGSLVKVSRIGNTESVFVQICHQVLKMYPMELRLPWRAWKVKLIDEGADDAGGAYDETISEMCTELQCSDPDLNILIPSPCDNTVFLPNPNPNVCQKYFKFLGILMGTAIRTKKPIDLNLDPLFWKLMTNSAVTIEDLRRLDQAYFNSLLSLDGVGNFDENYLKEVLSVENFVVFSMNRNASEIIFKGSERDVTRQSLSLYVQHAISFRLHEFDKCIAQVRDGFAGVSPLLFLDLMSWSQLEKAVCGSRTIHVSVLKSIARYVDADETNEIFSWFWDTIDNFSESEKSLFLRFVTGKSRLPSENSKIPFRLFIYLSKQPIDSLPQAQTCFNQIRLPRYQCRADLEYRLKIAISQCRSIDMDDYMLARNRDQ